MLRLTPRHFLTSKSQCLLSSQLNCPRMRQDQFAFSSSVLPCLFVSPSPFTSSLLPHFWPFETRSYVFEAGYELIPGVVENDLELVTPPTSPFQVLLFIVVNPTPYPHPHRLDFCLYGFFYPLLPFGVQSHLACLTSSILLHVLVVPFNG